MVSGILLWAWHQHSPLHDIHCLILFARRREIVLRNANLIINICGTILLILAVMNITGLMRHYKAFVLGFVL